MKKNEMGRACGMYGGKRNAFGFWWGSLGERDYWEDLSLDGRIILKLKLNRILVLCRVTYSTRKPSCVKTAFNMS
jgi:hypothetical protein